MGDGALRAVYMKWAIWNGDTERLFAEQLQAPRKYEEYTRAVTQQRGFRDRMRQYAGYLPLLLGRGATMTLVISITGMALAVSLGLLLALTYLYGPRPVAWATQLQRPSSLRRAALHPRDEWTRQRASRTPALL